MAPRKQTYEERLERFFKGKVWVTRNQVILRFGPDYKDALAELKKLVNIGTVLREGYKGKRGPASWRFMWTGVREL